MSAVSASVPVSAGAGARPEDAALLLRDPGIPFLRHALEPAVALDHLAERFPAEAAVPWHPRLYYLRYKPGLSLTAGVAVDGPEPVLMLGAVSVQQRPKVAKLLDRQQVGLGGWGAVADQSLGLVVATAASDRVLPGVAVVGGLRGSVAGVDPRTVHPIRYKPHRRWLATAEWRGQPGLVRVTSPRAARAYAPTYEHLCRTGLVTSLASHPRLGVTVNAWIDGEPLDGQRSDPASAEALGHALGRLHATALGPLRTRPDHTGDLRAAALAVAEICPRLAGVAQRLSEAVTDRLPTSGPPVLSHGDLSSDQAVVDRQGEVHLIDFDRACADHPAFDLGSWAADTLVRDPGLEADPLDVLAPLLRGYGGEVPGPQDLVACTAAGIVRRLAEPFRGHHPDWAGEVARRLVLARSVLDAR